MSVVLGLVRNTRQDIPDDLGRDVVTLVGMGGAKDHLLKPGAVEYTGRAISVCAAICGSPC